MAIPVITISRTDKGGALTSSLGLMASLKNLTLRFGYDVELMNAGIVAVAKALMPLRDSLAALRLDFGFTTIKEKQSTDATMACLDAAGRFTALRTRSRPRLRPFRSKRRHRPWCAPGVPPYR